MTHPVNVWTGRNDVRSSTEMCGQEQMTSQVQRNVWSGVKYDVIPSTGVSKGLKISFG